MRLILALLTLFLSSAAHADQIRLDVCANILHLPPYYLGQGTELPPKGKRGIFADALDETSEEIGLNVTWYRMPWSRCLNGLKNRQFGTVLGLTPSPEREGYLRFPQTIRQTLDQTRSMSPVHYHLYENRHNPLKWAGDTLFLRDKLRLGAPKGFVVTSTLVDQGLPIAETLNPYDGFSKLAGGKLDGFIFANKVSDTLIEHVPDGLNLIRRLDPPIWISYLYLPIQKSLYDKHPELFERLWSTYAQNIRKRVEPHF